MGNLAIRIGLNALALWLTALVVPGIRLGEEDPSLANRLVTILLVAVVFGVVNAFMKPIVTFFSLPFILLTLGLFTVVVNALMLLLTAWITGHTDWGLRIDGFWTAVWAALILSIISFFTSLAIGRRDKD